MDPLAVVFITREREQFGTSLWWRVFRSNFQIRGIFSGLRRRLVFNATRSAGPQLRGKLRNRTPPRQVVLFFVVFVSLWCFGLSYSPQRHKDHKEFRIAQS